MLSLVRLLPVVLTAVGCGGAAAGGFGAASASDTTAGGDLPTGMRITPTAASEAVFQDLNPQHKSAPDVRANGPASLAVSPDGKLLAVLTTGYNQFADRDGKEPPELSTEYLFVFDVTSSRPRQVQVFPVRASFQGLAWTPSGNRLFVSGGIEDEVVEFVRGQEGLAPGRTFQLGHKSWVGPSREVLASIGVPPCVWCSGEVSGLAASPDGRWLLVANILNDSVSLIDLATGRVITELDLRPGVIDPKQRGQPGGSYPRAVIWTSATHAYVASERDREIISLERLHDRMRVVRRIPVAGQPVGLVANRSGSRVYIALDTSSQLAILDCRADTLIESFDVVAPPGIYANAKMLGGANTNALSLLPGERTLLVSNGGENAIAVVALGDGARDAGARDDDRTRDPDGDRNTSDHSTVVALVPTGWYPSGVATSVDGGTWYVVNGKSPTGPNVSWCNRVDSVSKLCESQVGGLKDSAIKYVDRLNQHLEQLERAGLLAFPAPSPLELARLTKQVARNDHFDRPDETAAEARLFSFLHRRIKHVVYVMKENEPYDAILGDLEVGKGDPRLNLFPEKIAPNHHALARNFVDLDNTLVSGEGSPQGWTWTYAAQTTDYNERNEPHSYTARGVGLDGYGVNRGIDVGLATSRERHAESPLSPSDPDVLPGTHDVNAPDGPEGAEGQGYIWDEALRHGLSVRNWGMAPTTFATQGQWLNHFDVPTPIREPYKEKRQVFWTTKASLRPYSDPYYYTFDPAFPDYWRVKEWQREFDQFSAADSAPNLMLVWLGGDHLQWGDLIPKALDGVNTPETSMADNDYALGVVVDAVAHSPFANETLIFVIEDDAFNGPDHIDSHRTIALVAGPYVRQHAVVSTRYTTVSMVKTIDNILGIGPIGLNDALAAPMTDVFDSTQLSWSYQAIVPNVLRSTKLPLPPAEHASIEYPRHSASYWAKATAGQDASGPDRIEPTAARHALWRGLKGDIPYPSEPAAPRSGH